ncbi:nuclear receptor-interacting protein 2 isoform X3 [Panthera leo]|uniref:nuclear receptor-interacting protein 2 isoform X3 n=1 Tax=Panthera leo TaxID=9689 RepID=UPI001C6A2F7B|nr:nuclear receptor-interacting protein 2 isoform X3 [Panthera leo]
METRTVQQPPPCSSSSGSPAGATRQEARRVEGDSRRRGQEAALRDRAPLSQQRRLRQATQFLHKDSADLLPLDSLKRLGTSKDLQPHSVIQRRLVEGNQSRFQGESPPAQAPIHSQESRRKTSKTQIPALLVNCKCRDQELRVAVDTGTQHNQISAGCLSRLGLGKKVLKAPGGDVAPGPPTQVEQLELQLGQETVACSAQVVDSAFSQVLHRPRAWSAAAEGPLPRAALPASVPRAWPVTDEPVSPRGKDLALGKSHVGEWGITRARGPVPAAACLSDSAHICSQLSGGRNRKQNTPALSQSTKTRRLFIFTVKRGTQTLRSQTP